MFKYVHSRFSAVNVSMGLFKLYNIPMSIVSWYDAPWEGGGRTDGGDAELGRSCGVACVPFTNYYYYYDAPSDHTRSSS